MQPRAVIYCSKHGATKELAQCLGKNTNFQSFLLIIFQVILFRIFQYIFVDGFEMGELWD